jgi:hypothetical protein
LPPPAERTVRWPDPNVVRHHVLGEGGNSNADLRLQSRPTGAYQYRIRRRVVHGRVSHFVDVKNVGWAFIGYIDCKSMNFRWTEAAKVDREHASVTLFSTWWSHIILCAQALGITASCRAFEAAERAERQAERKRLKDAEVQRRLQQSLAKAAEALKDEPVPTPEQAILIHELIRRIAAADPDRAKELNGVGFGACDSNHGHPLAEMSELAPYLPFASKTARRKSLHFRLPEVNERLYHIVLTIEYVMACCLLIFEITPSTGWRHQ